MSSETTETTSPMPALGRVFAVCLVMSGLLALSGAFDTGGLSMAARMGYWFGLILVGTAIALTVAWVLARRFGLDDRPVPLGIGIVVLVTLLQTPVVMTAHWLLLHQPFSWRTVMIVGPAVFIITVAVTTLILMMTNQTPPVTHAAPPGAQPPAFLARIPLKLRGAELYAVEAEDHYLRLHTSRGQDLILMRLSDAVKELEGLEGAQTHRSWWVAKDALVDAERGDGRATLTLKDGSRAPVSRAYSKALREAGWF